MNVKEKVQAIKQGKLSSEKLCEEVLKAIEENDKNGRKLNAVTSINENWRKIARALDEDENKASSSRLLYGIPVLVKDNIEVKGMANTAGSYNLQDNISEDDAFVIRRLKQEGAVILGKCNLSEFAYWFSDEGMPSGYSSLNGQVVHPYNPSFDPSGSSSGSAVAVAARYLDLTVGTETDGSLMSPAISNGLVTLKPTVGLISRSGILPLSHVQDSAGPMANSVEDCVLLLQAMAGKDDSDPFSKNVIVKDYLQELQKDLTGKRIGVFTVKDQKHDKEYMDRLKQVIEENHGEVVELFFEEGSVDEYECLFNEFKYDINQYLESRHCKARNLADIIRMNEENKQRCLRYGQGLLVKSEAWSGSTDDEKYISLRKKTDEKARQIYDRLIKENELACIATVCGSAFFNLAAVTGGCSMALPARKVNEETYDPLSYAIYGLANQEDEIIRLAYTLQESCPLETKPSWLD